MKKYLIPALGIFFLAAAGACSIVWLSGWWGSGATIIGSVRRTSNTLETIAPITVAVAQQYINDFPPAGDLPESASNVEFAFYGEWVALTELIRFEAPVEDCIATAQRWIEAYNKDNPNRTVQGIRSLPDVVGVTKLGDGPEIPVYGWPDIGTGPLQATWFKPQEIRQGVVAGNIGSHQPTIWVDTDNGVFYYRYTD
jgi:hypothetical protein